METISGRKGSRVLNIVASPVFEGASAYLVVSASPNRLRSVRGKIGAGAYLVVRRWLTASSQTEQGLERSHGLFATIVPKDKFIQINGELSSADTVMGSDKPLLQVADRAVSQGHDGFRAFAKINAQRLNARHMLESSFLQSREAFQAIGIYG